MDGNDFIRSQQPESFDLIFADMPPGKFSLLEETLALLKPGGIYIVDDLHPQPNWPANHAPRVEEFLASFEQQSNFNVTHFDWSTGLLMAVKR
jgi:predicted O-methyltransferase YrrM